MNIQYISTWEYHGYIYIIYPYYTIIPYPEFFLWQPVLATVAIHSIADYSSPTDPQTVLVALYQHLKHLPEKSPSFVAKYTSTMVCIQCEAPKISKLVYNSNNYGLWYTNNYSYCL